MTQITIPAQVVNGHLQHEKSLAALEGQHFLNHRARLRS
jgi:hypothetical protein